MEIMLSAIPLANYLESKNRQRKNEEASFLVSSMQESFVIVAIS